MASTPTLRPNCVLLVGRAVGFGQVATAGDSFTEHGGGALAPGASKSTAIDLGARAASNVVFDNFGADNTYQTDHAYVLSVGSPTLVDRDQGEAFTPVGDDFVLDSIALAASWVLGFNDLDVWLMSDIGGEPGAVIEAFHFSDAMGPFPGDNPPLFPNSVERPVLKAGTQYWLIASTTGPDAWASWNFNSVGDVGPHVYRVDLGPWNVLYNETRGAFRIIGTPPPVINFSPTTYSVLEGTSYVDLTLTRSGSTVGEVNVHICCSHTEPNCDPFQYGSEDFFVGFGDGDAQSSGYSLLPIDWSDTVNDGDDEYTCILDETSGFGIIGAQDRATITVREDDSTSHCLADAIVLNNAFYGGGSYQVRSETSIETVNSVEVAADASVVFAAPEITLAAGFRVMSGAQFIARVETPTCPANPSAGDSAQVLAGKSSELDEPALAVAPAMGIDAGDLPDALASRLAGWRVDLAAVLNAQIDGRGMLLVFETAQGVLSQDRNGVSDVYAYVIENDSLVLVSRGLGGQAGNGPSNRPRIDAAGEVMVYQSAASDLVPNDTNAVSDIFLTHTGLWLTERISQTAEGWQAEGAAEHPAVDARGTQILYDRPDREGFRQIYGYLPKALKTETLSLAVNDQGQRLDSHHPGISADGRFLTYLETAAGSGVESDGCAVHVYDQGTKRFVRLACPQELTDGGEFVPFFSEDGGQIEWEGEQEQSAADSGLETSSGGPARVTMPNPLISLN